MKSTLILGMGSPLMGDDGIGCQVAELLAADPRLPEGAEALCGGTDLLRWTDQMEGRRRVILIDAVLGDAAPGTVEIFEDQFDSLETRQWNVHHLSLPQAIGLLQSALPALGSVRFILFAVTIASAQAHPGLSSELSLRLPEIL